MAYRITRARPHTPCVGAQVRRLSEGCVWVGDWPARTRSAAVAERFEVELDVLSMPAYMACCYAPRSLSPPPTCCVVLLCSSTQCTGLLACPATRSRKPSRKWSERRVKGREVGRGGEGVKGKGRVVVACDESVAAPGVHESSTCIVFSVDRTEMKR